MKEQLHTIPISDAMANAGECPFCYIEQKTEEHMMDFVLGHGASYMEADIRDMTDREGFCRAHFKKMFDYGNSLGNAWILKTLMKRHEEEMDHVWKTFRPGRCCKTQQSVRHPCLFCIFDHPCKRTDDFSFALSCLLFCQVCCHLGIQMQICTMNDFHTSSL